MTTTDFRTMPFRFKPKLLIKQCYNIVHYVLQKYDQIKMGEQASKHGSVGRHFLVSL